MKPTVFLIALPLALAAGEAVAGVEDPLPEIRMSIRHDTSPPLREMMLRAKNEDEPALDAITIEGSSKEPALQTATPRLREGVPALAQPELVFEGLGDADNVALLGRNATRADISADVGPAHYVEWINWVFGIWDKQGHKLAGPLPGNALWAGFGGPCQSLNQGEGNVIYDEFADRWLLSQIAVQPSGAQAGGHQCIAVSATPDPLGAYHRYDFVVTAPGLLIDFPSMGLWPDSYYLTLNEVVSPSTFKRVTTIAFERAAMLAGGLARSVKFALPRLPGEIGPFGVQPSHLDGPAPPAGTPNLLIMAWDDQVWGTGTHNDGYRLWAFKVKWSNPGNSSLTPLPQVDSSTSFDSTLCGFSLSAATLPCVPQLGTAQRLDSGSRYTLPRAQYRASGGQSTLVVAHTIDVGSERAGIRWVELQKSGQGWTLGQDGVQAPPDGLHRWTGSIAMNEHGVICLSYNVSSASTVPVIRYACGPLSETLAARLTEYQFLMPMNPGSQRGSGGSCSRGAVISSAPAGANRDTSTADGAQDCLGDFWLTDQLFVSETLPDLFGTVVACFDPPPAEHPGAR